MVGYAIVLSGDTVVNVLSGFEDGGLSTNEFIKAAQSGFADADEYDPSNYSGISLGAAAAEFAELDDIIAIIHIHRCAFPENMGCAGKDLFSVSDDENDPRPARRAARGTIPKARGPDTFTIGELKRARNSN